MRRFRAKKNMPERETLTEAYEVRAFRSEDDEQLIPEPLYPEAPHAEPGALQAVKAAVKGHGEQTIIPDDCQFGDNDLCYVEA